MNEGQKQEDTEMSETKKNEVAETGGFTAVMDKETMEVAAEDLAGLQLTFDRIKIPAGGSTAFEIPGDEDEPDMVKEIKGVILLHHPAYAYYKDKYTGGSNPPECGSFNGVQGIGTPGGACAECPFNQFGSGDGQSKACKNRRMIYVLMENELFPMVLSLPTGSLKEFTKYIKRQLTKGRKLSQIVTRISLKKATNANGIATFAFDRMLDAAEKAAVSQMVDQVKEYAANLTIASLAGSEEEPVLDSETGEVVEPLK